MRKRKFMQCDVFSSEATKGNGLAVVVDAMGLSDAQMQSFAAWTNLAETTFILPPENQNADYRLRIFTPTREMLFAGHPTLGSCAAWLRAGGVPKSQNLVRQECGVGIVEIDQRGEVPAFVAPPTKVEALTDEALTHIVDALKIDRSMIVRTAQLTNGPQWQVIELQTAEQVLAVDSSRVKWPLFQPIGLIGAYSDDGVEYNSCDYEVRMLAPSSGMSEDPITGSLNAAIACWMHSEGRLVKNLTVAQGTNIGRSGRVFISSDLKRKDHVLIGGVTQVLIDGYVML